MNVGERVRVRVPAAKAEVEASYGGVAVIDNDNFLVVRPELDTVCN